MNPIDLTLYLVLDAHACGGKEQTFNVARKALKSGITVLQLRNERLKWTKREWFEMALALKMLCKNTGVPFIVNDHVDIALAADADGIHIGQGDLPATVVRQLMGPKKIVGLSTHNVEQVQAASRLPVDYIGLGPVYPTQSKDKPDAVIGEEGLSAMVAVKKLPGVAIGGINAQNVQTIRRINPDGIAVISAICCQSDVEAATRALLPGHEPG